MTPALTRGQLLAEKVRLERRLAKGWDAIGLAEAAGRDHEANRYLAVWLGVLAEYERTCDTLRAKEGR